LTTLHKFEFCLIYQQHGCKNAFGEQLGHSCWIKHDLLPPCQNTNIYLILFNLHTTLTKTATMNSVEIKVAWLRWCMAALVILLGQLNLENGPLLRPAPKTTKGYG